MKKDKIIYWTATGIVAAIMLWSAFNFSLNEEMKGAFARLGLPNWFRIELTVAKILGALALIIPTIPNRIKEFAYCGFTITLISATIAHFSSGDGIASIDPLVFLGILIISYFYYYRAQIHRQPATAASLPGTGD
jgi:DoxX-like family